MPGDAEREPGPGTATERLAGIRERAESARQRAEVSRRSAEEVRVKTRQVHERYAALAAAGPSGYSTPVEGRPGPGAEDPRARGRLILLRRRAAAISEHMADAAETFATYLEAAAERGDREHRLAVAAVEREIAGVERRNAARLRQDGEAMISLESLPRLPGWQDEVPDSDDLTVQ